MVGAALFAAAAIFGVQRVLRGYEMSANDKVPVTIPRPAPENPQAVLPLPPEIPAPADRLDSDPLENKTSRAPARAVSRRRVPAARRQPSLREQERLNGGDRSERQQRQERQDGIDTEPLGPPIIGSKRRLDGDNPYGGPSVAPPASSDPQPRRSIDRANPWEAGDWK